MYYKENAIRKIMSYWLILEYMYVNTALLKQLSAIYVYNLFRIGIFSQFIHRLNKKPLR